MTADCPELCEPCEITTYSDLPNTVELCIQCGVTRTITPTPPPVCFVKGGRATCHDTSGAAGNSPPPTP